MKNSILSALLILIWPKAPISQDKEETKKDSLGMYPIPALSIKNVSITSDEVLDEVWDEVLRHSNWFLICWVNIYTMPITGANRYSEREGHAFEGTPRYSPDGQEYKLTSDAGGGGHNIWIMNTDGTESKQNNQEEF